jgi:hypothetical protein
VGLSKNEADELELFIQTDSYRYIEQVYNERIDDWQRKVLTGRLDHDEYVRACQSIREAEYLRDRPKQLIHEARLKA